MEETGSSENSEQSVGGGKPLIARKVLMNER